MNLRFYKSRKIDQMVKERDFDRIANIADAYYSEDELYDAANNYTCVTEDGIHTGILLVKRLLKLNNPKARIFETTSFNEDNSQSLFYFVGTEESICRKLKKISWATPVKEE